MDNHIVWVDDPNFGSGNILQVDEHGRITLTPEIERVIEERVNARIAQFAAGLLVETRLSGDFLARALTRTLRQWAAPAEVVDHGDLFEPMRGHGIGSKFSFEDILRIVERGQFSEFCRVCGLPDTAHIESNGLQYGCSPGGAVPALPVECENFSARCSTCNGTGFDYPSFSPCPDCNPSGYPKQQVQDALPQPPLSACCKADVFEERGRTICEKCRVGCKLAP